MIRIPEARAEILGAILPHDQTEPINFESAALIDGLSQIDDAQTILALQAIRRSGLADRDWTIADVKGTRDERAALRICVEHVLAALYSQSVVMDQLGQPRGPLFPPRNQRMALDLDEMVALLTPVHERVLH